LPVSISERAFVTMTSIKPLVRKKICRFVPDTNELIRLLSREEALF